MVKYQLSVERGEPVAVIMKKNENKAFKIIRPVFRERGKINAEVTGRLTETLNGVFEETSDGANLVDKTPPEFLPKYS